MRRHLVRASKNKIRNQRIATIISQLHQSYSIQLNKLIAEVADEYSLSEQTIYRIYTRTEATEPCDFVKRKMTNILEKMKLKPIK